MPITQVEAKKRLAELSSQGGGIISGAAKSEIEPNSRILVIGLGGLGCKTVNELAGIYRNDFNDQGRLSWIAIDTDEDCFTRISSLNGGNIEQGDTFHLYRDDVQYLLKQPRTPYIRSFVHDEVPPYPITKKGAQQRRIVGKVMLCGGSVYGELRTELKHRIEALGGGPGGNGMQIIIVAGISGGTGSGTFIDVSYMVRELAKENTNNSVFGVFYTPDVQRNEPWCNAAIWANLQRNGYASMKELDYFMSVGDSGNGGNVVYSLPLNKEIDINGVPVKRLESKLPIFEREYVFMISETDNNKTEWDIIRATAVSLLNLFRESMKLAGEKTQNILSNLCNIKAKIDTWGNDTIGLANDPSRQNDGIYGERSKMKYTDYPVSFHYSYAAFDYKSVYIPRNEMAAYCTNIILNDLLHNKFERAIHGISNVDIDQLSQACSLDSLEAIFATADAQNGWHNWSLRIQENSAAYPQSGFLGVHCDASAAVNEASQIAINAIKAANADMNRIWGFYENALKSYLFNNAKLWNLVGPYGVIVFMSGMEDSSVRGLIQRVQDYSVDLVNKIRSLQSARDAAQSAMQNAKNELAEDAHVTNAEIVRMVDLCEAFSKAEYEYQLYAQAMPVVLNTIEAQLVELNNRTFETYVPLMQAIEEIVNEDADRFMHSTLENNGYGAVYCVDAFNIDNALANSSLFADFFEGYLNNQAVIAAEQNLFSTLFNAENRAYWEALTTTDDQLQAANNAVQKVREVFRAITDPLIKDMLEKFIVMIYCAPSTFKAKILQPGEVRPITLADLDAFWDNNPGDRNAALQIAAGKILSELNRGGMIKYSVDPHVCDVFNSSVEVISIPDLPNLNAIIKARVTAAGGAFNELPKHDENGNRPKTEIALYKNSGPFPLTFVNRMREYAVRYYASEVSDATAAGRHGDEVTECWQENMPELYGVDADQYFEATKGIAPITEEEHPRGNHDQKLFAEVRELVKTAMSGGYLYLPENENRYKLVVLKKQNYAGDSQLTVDELLAKIVDKLLDMLKTQDLLHKEASSAPTWVDAVKALGEEQHHNALYYLDEHYLDVNVRIINSNFSQVQTEKPEFDYEISNLERLVRMDMTILNEIRKEVKFYKEKDFFGEIERRTAALSREQGMKLLVGYYLAAYKLGWISIEKGHLICKSADGKLDEDLLDCRTGFGSGLDAQLVMFLKLSAFCAKIEANDIIKKRIQSAYAPFQLIDDLLTDDQKVVKAAMPDWKGDVLEPLRKIMESDDFKDHDMESIFNEVYRKYGLSKYQKTYGYPTSISSGKDIVDNVNKALKALDHFAEVGDNSLVPDLE